MFKIGLRVFGVLAAIVIVFLVIGGISRTRSRAHRLSKIQTIGLPESGIEIVGPADEAFDALMSKQAQASPRSDLGALNASSVFVTNTSAQSVAALSVRWELLQGDGRTIVHVVTYSGGLRVVTNGGPPHLSEQIAPNARHFASLLDGSAPSNRAFRINMGGGGIDKARQLSESVKVTVSVDGVLFADGRFVGPDASNYFESLKSEIEARSEAYAEIARALSGDSEAMKRVEMLGRGNGEGVQLSTDGKGTPDVQLFKEQLARNTLAFRTKLGDKTMLERINAELNKPRIELRKL